ncbi:MAG: hypothetical protein RTU30_01310 [Candidatus Thorarchaeota archaeon]
MSSVKDVDMMDDSTDFKGILSPSAWAFLDAIKRIEDHEDLDLFQTDPSIDRLQIMADTYRGKLSTDLMKRISQVIDRGNISIITQQDLTSMVESVWLTNVSKLSTTELKLLGATCNIPGATLKSLGTISRLTYSQTRRASKRLRASELLKIRGLLNCGELGLTRILLVLENSELVVTGPYVEKALFVDGAIPTTYLVVKVPTARLNDMQNVIRSLRNVSSQITAWKLAPGSLSCSGGYYNTRKSHWEPDLLHFSLVMRNSMVDLTVSDLPLGVNQCPDFGPTGPKVVDCLQKNYEYPAADIAKIVGVSQSTSFRLRNDYIKNNYVVPRAKVDLLNLGDRVIGLLDPDIAGDVITAWDLLPITYVSQAVNLENPSDRKVVFLASMPSGTGRDLVQVLKSEMSRANSSPFHTASSGIDGHLRVASMFDRRAKEPDDGWKWSLDFIDARSYTTIRREAESETMPNDLA